MHILNTPAIVVLIVLALFAAFVTSLRLFGRKTQKAAAAYEAVPALLTPAERSFYGVLQQVFPLDYQIFTKVRLADVVRPVRNPSRSDWKSAFNRIAGKHVDFVLCDSAQLNVVGVIELDDRTHERFERRVRDSLVDAALVSAGIPVLRVSTRQSYSPTQIREQADKLFRLNERSKNKPA